MARNKQTAHKSDSKGKITQVTFDQPFTKPYSTSTTMDKPKQAPTNTDQTQGTQPQTVNPQGKPSVDPEVPTQAPAQLHAKADHEEEDIVEFNTGAEGDTGGKAGPSTTSATSSTPITHKCKHDDDEDEESRRYIGQSGAAAEAWKKAVTEATDENVAKAAYSMLYKASY